MAQRCVIKKDTGPTKRDRDREGEAYIKGCLFPHFCVKSFIQPTYKNPLNLIESIIVLQPMYTSHILGYTFSILNQQDPYFRNKKIEANIQIH